MFEKCRSIFVLNLSIVLFAACPLGCDGEPDTDHPVDDASGQPDAADVADDAGDLGADTGDAASSDASRSASVSDVELASSSGEARIDDDLLVSFEQSDDVLTALVDWRVDTESIVELALPLDRQDAGASPDLSQRDANCELASGAAAPGVEPGRIGRAYGFDGADDELSCTGVFDFSRPFSFELWMRPAAGTQPFENAGLAAAVDDAQQWSWQLRYGAPQTARLGFKFNLAQGEPVWLSASSELAGEQWHHIVATHDGARVRMYVDGEQVDSAPASQLVAVDTLRVGQEGWQQFFAGRIDAVRVFSRAISSAQVQALYDAGLDGQDARKLVGEETRGAEQWQACVTPTAGAGEGATVCSNTVTIEDGQTDPPGTGTDVPDDALDVTELGIRGDGSDETAAIQALLDDADDDQAFYFPPTDDFYGIGAPGLKLNKPVRLYGDGWVTGGAGRRHDSVGTFSGSTLRNVDPGGWSGTMITVRTSGVLIDGLQVLGESYVGIDWADNYVTRIVSIDGEGRGRYENFTLRNSWLQGAESVLWIDHVDDFIVDNSHIQDGRQSLIFMKLVHRGMVRSTNYWNSGAPPVGGPAYEGGGNPTGKGYGLVVTTPRTQPERSSDMLIYDNWGKGVALWFTDHNHGCHRYLSFNNLVEDSRYGFSGSALNTSDYGLDTDQWYLNNMTRDMRLSKPSDFTSTGYAFTSGRYLDGFHMIGNVATRTDGQAHRAETFRARGQAGGGNGVVTWNEIRGPADTPHLKNHNNPQIACAHNTIDGQPMQVEGSYQDISSEFSVPQVPTGLSAMRANGGVELTWSYPKGRTHDSFYVEWSADGASGWQRVAYTPPHNGIFDFDAPTNSYWEHYNPLRWFDEKHSDGFYRIRANNGDKVSAWSEVADVN